jgi:hypothetical protein
LPSNYRLYTIVNDDDGVTVDVPGLNPVHALLVFHTEALGLRSVRLRNGRIWFRDREDQLVCAGKWVITEQGGTDDATIVEIPEPPDK